MDPPAPARVHRNASQSTSRRASKASTIKSEASSSSSRAWAGSTYPCRSVTTIPLGTSPSLSSSSSCSLTSQGAFDLGRVEYGLEPTMDVDCQQVPPRKFRFERYGRISKIELEDYQTVFTLARHKAASSASKQSKIHHERFTFGKHQPYVGATKVGQYMYIAKNKKTHEKQLYSEGVVHDSRHLLLRLEKRIKQQKHTIDGNSNYRYLGTIASEWRFNNPSAMIEVRPLFGKIENYTPQELCISTYSWLPYLPGDKVYVDVETGKAQLLSLAPIDW